MSRNVFVLGAGASAQAGAPLMSSFIPRAQELRRIQHLNSDDQSAFDLVFNARSQLQSVFSKARVNINNIESLFGVFEMALLIGKLGRLPTDDISKLSPAIIRMIGCTIEQGMKYRVASSSEFTRILPPVPYLDFGHLIQNLTNKSRSESEASVITFNYDIGLDYAFNYVGLDSDYCLQPKEKTSNLDVLKLHGSLNWSRCQQCGSIVPYLLTEYFRTHQWSPYLDAKEISFEISKKLAISFTAGELPMASLQ